MTTLAQVLLQTAYCLKSLRNALATGGSTTTLIDTLMIEPDRFFDNGTLFFLSGTLIGKTAVITDWDETTKTFTFPTQSAAVVSGVRYGVCENRYPREALVQAINQALVELGPLLQRNEALVTVVDQAEYTLPAGVFDVKRVQFATETAAPYLWDAPHHWWMEWNGKLVFDENHLPDESDLLIRIWYEANHAAVYLDADTISDAIHINRLAWTAAWLAALNRSGLAENSEPHSKEVAGIANQMRIMQGRHPIYSMQRDARWAEWA